MFLIALLGIALIDSLNPTALVIQGLILSRPKPLAMSSAFIIGVFSTYLAFGIMLISGGRFLFSSEFWDKYSTPPVFATETIIGVVILLFGIRALINRDRIQESDHDRARAKVERGSMAACFLLAVVTVSAEIPTALPYFAALDIILKKNVEPLTSLFLLVLYNLVFILPQFLLVGGYIIARPWITGFMEKNEGRFANTVKIAGQWLIFLVGLLLIVDSTLYFITGTPLIP